MYLNGEKPGAGGGRGRGRGGPGAGGRGGLLTSPAGRGAPPPRSALLDTVCANVAQELVVIYLAPQKMFWLPGPYHNWSNAADLFYCFMKRGIIQFLS